jgi:long-subunit acyl-CoA synthetase (AMP-forming)
MERLFKIPVIEAYAMMEAAHQMICNPFNKRKPGTVGVGVGVEVRIVDKNGRNVEMGEVVIRGANVTSGYINRPEANAAAFLEGGFFCTGDQGYFDKDGYLVLRGRLS